MIPNIRRNTLLKALGLTSRLPNESRLYHDVMVNDNGVTYGPFMVKVQPIPVKGRRNHRIMIVCPKCYRDIPAGRYGQHHGSKQCELDMRNL